jgi:hypothetical protein
MNMGKDAATMASQVGTRLRRAASVMELMSLLLMVVRRGVARRQGR